MVSKVILAIILITACSCFCVWYNSAVQPNLGNEVAMHQLPEMTTNNAGRIETPPTPERGSGNEAANYRRMITATFHWPTEWACGLTTLLLIGMFYPDVKKLFKKMKEEASKV